MVIRRARGDTGRFVVESGSLSAGALCSGSRLECVTKLASDKRTINLCSQLFRSLGSISANLAEGYSRGSGRDRARFYEYALGSARESRGWYYQGRHILEDAVISHRLGLITQIIKLLLKMVPQQRGHVLYEQSPDYEAMSNDPIQVIQIQNDD